MLVQHEDVYSNFVNSIKFDVTRRIYEYNLRLLNKKKIKMFKGEYTKRVLERAYTDKEIKKILDVSDLRAKTIVLLMASSGLRIGSIPDLRLRNIKKIDNIYKITAYQGFNSQYFTFCTPECTSYMDAYLQFRSKYEKLDKNSYLIRDQFDLTNLDQIRNRSKAISTLKNQL